MLPCVGADWVRPTVLACGKQASRRFRIAAENLIASLHEADDKGEGKGFEVLRPRAFASFEGRGSIYGVTICRKTDRCDVAGTRSEGTPN
jgi:hypothetical protein